MGIFDILAMICGLALFLFGMNTMGDALKKSAGNKLKATLGKMTSSTFKSFMLGLGVTVVMQSSSATTVMIVGFVNSGMLALSKTVGAIIGANVGASVTSWLTGLSGLEGGADVTSALAWLQPSSWMPVLAIIGVAMLMFSKRDKQKDIALILLGFSVLMVGMEMMGDAVSVLKDDEGFKNILLLFENPILGCLAGLAITAVIQSSSASLGILQSLSTTGAITYGAAIPIIVGENIGTCATALLSSIGANRSGKRAALVHLYFNIISAVVILALFVVADKLVTLPFVDDTINMWGIAFVNTAYKLLSLTFMVPLKNFLVKLAEWTLPDKKEKETANMLDDRLMATPAVATVQAYETMRHMAEISVDALKDAMSLIGGSFDKKVMDRVGKNETEADELEDAIGTYLVKLSSCKLTPTDSLEATKILHLIGDYERISDHAVNIAQSAEEMHDKGIGFSPNAVKEITVLQSALVEILNLTSLSLEDDGLIYATRIEPLEQVIDHLCADIKRNHIQRLQNNECGIEAGFILSDLLNNYERVSDHCSNIGGCIIELGKYKSLNVHMHLDELKSHGNNEFNKYYVEYSERYAL